jgi:hypothetical protein
MFYNTGDMYECCWCRLNNCNSPYFLTAKEALDHLKEHRAAGHKVPDDAIEALTKELGHKGRRSIQDSVHGKSSKAIQRK